MGGSARLAAMSDLLVIVPSRGRPQNIVRLHRAWRDTDATADLIVALDVDDPEVADYPYTPPWQFDVALPSTPGMTAALNRVAVKEAYRYAAVGFMGDDHVPRTPRWDEAVLTALAELGTGIVYGNDLFQRENLPTAVFLTADIVQKLGYMAPPAQHHLYLDDAWLALGRALGAIRYLPEVVIEHMHPSAGGKAPMDEHYARVNAPEMYDHDRVEFERWREHELPLAVEKIRS